ncbi:MAG TPA: DUF4136 domain-containing protein [Pyrinomonadaceae bacterium]|nr:DUF4136 domain-containing protein [Pyrinomonadaceae bacterium]
MKKFLSLLVIATSLGVAYAQKVKVSSDPGVDLSKCKNYAWASGNAVANPIINQLIVESIDQALTAKGLTRVTDGPDITLAVLAAVNSDLQIFEPTWGRSVSSATGSGMPGSVHSAAISKGTLIVDIADARTKATVWRGTATQTLKEAPSGNFSKDAKTAEKSIRKAVDKMFKKFPARQ